MDGDSLQTKNWQSGLRSILQAWANLIFEMGSRHWNFTGSSALVYRKTTLKHKSDLNEASFFLPPSENFSNYPRKFWTWNIVFVGTDEKIVTLLRYVNIFVINSRWQYQAYYYCHLSHLSNTFRIKSFNGIISIFVYRISVFYELWFFCLEYFILYVGIKNCKWREPKITSIE